LSPAGKREALIVAVSDYRDAKLRKLRAPAADADRLAAVLRDPEIGGFDVEVVADPEERDLRRRLAIFFGADRRPDDLLLVHFSCHGVKDQSNELYLAAADTQEDLLDATGIDASWLNQRIGRCRSKRIVVLLDCCFSGSFPFGARARAGTDVNVQAHLEGRGRAVITASNAMEYAYEGDQLTGEGQPSVFTDAIVEALRTGEADRDGDRQISIQELYDYVFDRVKETHPAQTPNMMSTLEGPLHIARSSYEPPVEPAELDKQLLGLVEHPVAGARLGAVGELAHLLRSDDRATALAARQALERMVDDDSRRVSAAASDSLSSVATPAPPERPATPTVQGRTGADWAAGGRQLLQVTHGFSVYGVAFSPDGRHLATAGGQIARVWELPGGREVAQLKQQGFGQERLQDAVNPIAFSADGRYLAIAAVAALVNEFPGGRSVVLVVHEPWIFGVAFSPDGRYFATGSGDRTARVWELPGGREMIQLNVGGLGPVRGVAFSPDGRYLATAGGAARVWELPRGREMIQLNVGGLGSNGVAFSPDGRYLATAGVTAQVWELPEGREAVQVEHERHPVNCVAFSPDGRYLASGSLDRTARAWELPGGREVVQRKHDGPVNGVAFSPDGRYLVTGSSDQTAVVWEVPGRTQAQALRSPWSRFVREA
jgi:hypothetical protein